MIDEFLVRSRIKVNVKYLVIAFLE